MRGMGDPLGYRVKGQVKSHSDFNSFPLTVLSFVFVFVFVIDSLVICVGFPPIFLMSESIGWRAL